MTISPASKTPPAKEASEDESPAEPEEPEEDGPIPTWEKALSVLGMLLILASVGFLLSRAFSGPPSPPEITARVLGVTPQRAGYLVRLRVLNSGESTASQVKVTGELRRGEEVVETRETTLGYVPQESHVDAGLFFTKDPSEHRLEVFPEGYEEP